MPFTASSCSSRWTYPQDDDPHRASTSISVLTIADTRHQSTAFCIYKVQNILASISMDFHAL